MIGLVVAPSAIAARIVEQLVLRAGCREVRSFHCASDAEAAVRTDLRPALLATEWDLPDRSGIELAGAVREALERPDFPVLLIGTRNSQGDVLDALEAGIDVYILKPIDPDVFVARATALLRARQQDAAIAGSIEPAGEPGEVGAETLAAADRPEATGSGSETAGDPAKATGDGSESVGDPAKATGDGSEPAAESATDEPEAAAA